MSFTDYNGQVKISYLQKKFDSFNPGISSNTGIF